MCFASVQDAVARPLAARTERATDASAHVPPSTVSSTSSTTRRDTTLKVFCRLSPAFLLADR